MTHSQNNEEQLILRYFGTEVGTFLDLGANDGVTLSNTRSCVLRGWKGVLVDASPTIFPRLEASAKGHEGVICINAAIGSVNAKVKLHDSGPHLGKGDAALLSTILAAEVPQWEASGNTFTDAVTDCMTFDRLIDVSPYKTFDLISIDIEGMDMEVLRQMDLTALGCRMLIIEHEHLNADEMVAYANMHGLRLSTKNMQNLILVR